MSRDGGASPKLNLAALEQGILECWPADRRFEKHHRAEARAGILDESAPHGVTAPIMSLVDVGTATEDTQMPRCRGRLSGSLPGHPRAIQ